MLVPSKVRKLWQGKSKLSLLFRIVGSGFLLLFLVFLFYAKDLPSPGKINARVGAQTTKFYDRTGQNVLYEVYGNKNRSVVAFDQMSQNIKNATIAVEDKDFYKHGAFSVFGIGRAMTGVIFRDASKGGGSTITQQYVKNILLTGQRSYSRKIRELILAIEIEQFYKKDDILKLYLNEIPYGSNSYGIQAASQAYFKKDAKDLDVPEAALLAAIPRAPTYYSPYGQHKDDLIARQHLILTRMAEQRYITKDQAAEAKKVDILARLPKNANLYATIKAPHFVLYVQELLEEKYGAKVVTEGGLKVITTLDLEKQKASEEAVAKNMKQVRSLGGSNAAVVSSDPRTGQMLSMVGSHDFSETQLNVAIANRQPGSSFKPFVYATAWQKNWGPGSTIYDVRTDFGGGYRPTNFTSRDYGVLSMRAALGGSLNVSAVKTLYLAGITDSIKTSREMGITTLNDPTAYGLSLVLGTGEVKLVDMVNAYEGFAAEGIHHKPVTVLKITDSKGKTLEEFKPSAGRRVLDPQVAYLMNHALSDKSAKSFIFGNFAPFNFGNRPVAVKTGTTENFKDAWTMGYTPSLVAGVWVGNNDGKSMGGLAGAIAAPIWHDFMAAALANTPIEQFVRPAGIKEVTLDADTGRLPTDTTKNKRTDIFGSWYKPVAATATKSAVVDKISGKLATDCTPALAKETRFASEIHAEIPPTDVSYARWEGPVQALAASLGYTGGGNLPTDNDDTHKCSDAKPGVTLTASQIASSSSYSIKAVVDSGTFTANKLDIYLNDQIISTQTISGDTTYEFTYNVPTAGNHTLKAVATDAGLYTGEDSKTITVGTVAPASSAFNGLTPANGGHAGPGSINFTWTESEGANKYTLYWRLGSSGAYSNDDVGSSRSKTKTLVTPGIYYWYVESYLGSNLLATTTVMSFTNP